MASFLCNNTGLEADASYGCAKLGALRGEPRAGAAGRDTAARRHYSLIAGRFKVLVETLGDQPFYMKDLSRELGISDRTLRLACRTMLGMSPGQYIMLRRMQIVRDALRKAEPGVVRVTDVATANGFCELGRFSVKYRHIFGETPSPTLRGNR